MKRYTETPEIVLGNTPDIDVPELQVSYTRKNRKDFGKINTSKDAADFIRNSFNTGEVELQEQFIVLYLSQSNNIIGYYKHSKGAINATVADIRIILATALKSLAVAMVIAHNHPSGNLKPSIPDEALTRKIKEGAAMMDIKLIDHVIVTADGYYSFADSGLLGFEQDYPHFSFVKRVEDSLRLQHKHNKVSIEKLAASFGITDKTTVKELTELAIVKRARALAHSEGTIKQKFDTIVALYYSQVNLSHRTSQSILLQQYSTPAPIGYIAGVFCGMDRLQFTGGFAFEPSAGNGLLTIAALTERVYVNEIDTLRNANLRTQGFANVWNRDATKPFFDVQKMYSAVITNPPFGMMEHEVMYDTFPIKSLEHTMALRTLDCMANDGRAAIIIGGHTKWDERGRIQAGKNRIFFNYLYSRYHVKDVINIEGSKLYSRQGTSFDVRLILIDGRITSNHLKGGELKPLKYAPVFNPDKDYEVKNV
jgi:predicted RNA methylase